MQEKKMKTITTGVKKTAAAAALAGLALIGATSLTAAGDEQGAVETAPIVKPAPEVTGLPVPPPIVEEPPADLPEPILPAEPEPIVTAAPVPAPAPEPEPEFDYVEAVPWVPGAPIGELPPEIIHEDDPRFDCRYMGNQRCGVEIHGVIYVITFENGAPTGAYQR